MEDFTGKTHVFLHLTILLSVLFLACIRSVPQNAPRQIAVQQSPQERQRSWQFPYPSLGLISTNTQASEVWKQFTNEGRYRVASKEDFEMSEDKYRPYGDGDFNDDHEYDDFAAIVVDTQRTGTSRFGIVIFNAREGRQGYDGPYWLYRESDLSRTNLNTSSHGPLLVAEHRDDGTINVGAHEET